MFVAQLGYHLAMNESPEMRRCPRCEEVIPVEQFYWKNRAGGIRQRVCIPCHKKYVRAHYEKNTQYYLDKAERNRPYNNAKIVALLAELKATCADCGMRHPAVLEFHHLDPTKKEGMVGKMSSMKKIREEAAKCVVLCANCHRIRHWNDRLTKGKSKRRRYSSMDRAPVYGTGDSGSTPDSGSIQQFLPMHYSRKPRPAR